METSNVTLRRLKTFLKFLENKFALKNHSHLSDSELSTTSTNPVQNKIVTTEISALKKETTVNLLNPTLQTTTQNGVTCTNNGDGTYTLNGTNSSDTQFSFQIGNMTIINKDRYKLLGCPANKSINTIHMFLNNADWSIALNDVGNGDDTILPSGIYDIHIEVRGNETVNDTFKPMLTTNLSATYNDFVPYTGNTGSLNGDMAESVKTLNNKANIDHTHTKSEVGLSNVDNTADANKHVKYATSADSANMLTGFYNAPSKQTWGNQTGSFISGMDDSTGGSIAFRRDNPNAGQMSAIIDGRWYQNEGQFMCLDTNNYKDYCVGKNGDGASGTWKINITGSVNGHTVNNDVPANAKFTDTTYNNATTSAHGLMSPSDKTKLDSIATGANKIAVDSSTSTTSNNPISNSAITSALNKEICDRSVILYPNMQDKGYDYGFGAPTTASHKNSSTYIDLNNGRVYAWNNGSYINTGYHLPNIYNTFRQLGPINNLTTTTTGSALDAYQGKALDDKITDLKKSVSDGKSAIASAITDKGVSTSSDASFATMATNIKNISNGLSTSDRVELSKNCSYNPSVMGSSVKTIINAGYPKGAPFDSSSTSINAWYLIKKQPKTTQWGDYIFYNFVDHGGYDTTNSSGTFDVDMYIISSKETKSYKNVSSITLPKSESSKLAIYI